MAYRNCPSCKTPLKGDAVLTKFECGMFCDNEIEVCARCTAEINAGKRSRLCLDHLKLTSKERRSYSSNNPSGAGDQDDNNPWGDNAKRALEGD